MREQRAAHAISVVNIEDFAEHCDFSRSLEQRTPPVRPANRQHMWEKQCQNPKNRCMAKSKVQTSGKSNEKDLR